MIPPLLALSVSPLAQTPPMMMSLMFLFTIFTMISLLLHMSSWMAMMLIIIYMGGLIVMFSYFLCVAPNLSLPMAPMMKLAMLNTGMMIWLPKLKTITPPTQSHKMISSLMNSVHTSSIVMLTCILFMMLIIVVTLTKNSGALRSFS